MNDGPRKSAGGKCAICSKPIDPLFRPFCSKRCADIDLNRWLKGNYAIPAEEADEFDEDGDGR
jgi:endogenous inhibitor of DNA gyrase (YacG/DUF329 family)